MAVVRDALYKQSHLVIMGVDEKLFCVFLSTALYENMIADRVVLMLVEIRPDKPRERRLVIRLESDDGHKSAQVGQKLFCLHVIFPFFL